VEKESGRRMHIKFESINNKLIGEDDENIRNCNKKTISVRNEASCTPKSKEKEA
jgi:hypothetical protein